MLVIAYNWHSAFGDQFGAKTKATQHNTSLSLSELISIFCLMTANNRNDTNNERKKTKTNHHKRIERVAPFQFVWMITSSLHYITHQRKTRNTAECNRSIYRASCVEWKVNPAVNESRIIDCINGVKYTLRNRLKGLHNYTRNTLRKIRSDRFFHSRGNLPPTKNTQRTYTELLLRL